MAREDPLDCVPSLPCWHTRICYCSLSTLGNSTYTTLEVEQALIHDALGGPPFATCGRSGAVQYHHAALWLLSDHHRPY